MQTKIINSSRTKILIGIILGIIFLSTSVQAQKCDCDADRHTKKGINTLQDEGGYVFLRSYAIDKQEKKYSYIFSQGTKYFIALADSDSKAEKVVLNVYDDEDNLIASNVVDGKYHPSLAFNCRRTGIYRMEFAPEKAKKDYCAAGVLGMKR